MPETFADSPTRAVVPIAVRDLWTVQIDFETGPHQENGMQIEPAEVLSVVYTVRAPNYELALHKAIADIYIAHEADGVLPTITRVRAEALPAVLE